MKTKFFYTSAHAANGISLTIIPETTTENTLFETLWKHGHIETNNAAGTMDFVVRTFQTKGPNA